MSWNRWLGAVSLTGAMALGAGGCSSQSGAKVVDVDLGTGDASALCQTAPAATLDTIFAKYLQANPSSGVGACATSGCHGGTGAGGLAFDTAAQFSAATVNVAAQSGGGAPLIKPGDPAGSVVYRRLLASAGLLRMPQGGPFFDDAAAAEIAGWICSNPAPADGGVPGNQPPVFAGAQSAAALPSSITLSWSAATDDATPASSIEYLVYQATSPGGESFATPSYVTAPGELAYSIGALPVSTTYYFVVRARDAAGAIDGNTKEVSATTPATADTTPPTFAGATSATADSASTITVTWSAATDDVSQSSKIVYLGYVATTSGGQTFATPSFTTIPGVTSYQVSGLSPGQAYHVVVRARDQAGNIDGNTVERSATTPAAKFGTDVYPILQASCLGAACHSGAMPKEGLDMGTKAKAYANLVNVASSQCSATKRVLPNQPTQSYLMWKLQGSGSCFTGTRMPKTGSLSAASQALIGAWITAGAANN